MKFIVLLSCFAVVLVYAADPQMESVDEIADEEFRLEQDPEIHIRDDGSFVLSLVEKDGSRYEEEGIVVTDEKTGEEIVVSKKGTYSYPGKDGKFVRVAYGVDEPTVQNLMTSE